MLIGCMTVLVLFMQCICVSLTVKDWSDCLEGCHCKWISGKKTALCRDAGFTSIPDELHPEMQVLDLSGNSIPYLEKEVFKTVGLMNLQRIFLKSAGVHEVHKDAFKELKIMVEVDLSDNFIASLHPDTFTGNERLRVLYMSGNPISELRNAQFPTLPHLRSLEFQHCQIKHIHRDAFLNINALESLSINGNKLNFLSETVFLPIPKLKTLVLDENPWKCDCELKTFRKWLLTSKLYSNSLICTYPESSKGKQWEDIEEKEFACAPNVALNASSVQSEIGGNITFRCKVIGDPEPDVMWYFNGYSLLNDTYINGEGAIFIDEQYTDTKNEKWSSIYMFNVSEAEAGTYTCSATNLRGQSTANASIVLPKEAVATTMKKNDSIFLLTAVIGGSVGSIVFLIVIICICHIRRRSSKKTRRKGRLRSCSNISEQDNKLLDGSVSTTDRQTGSCEIISSRQDIEMAEQSVHSIPLDQPVHITIESRSTDPSMAVYPPPPEFSSSVLPHGAFGNIFISVSVGQDPHSSGNSKYPDLLDVSRKSNMSVGTSSDPVSYLATLPRRKIQNRSKEIPSISSYPHYDNMGPRITADGSSIISLPETISNEDIPAPPPSPFTTTINNFEYNISL